MITDDAARNQTTPWRIHQTVRRLSAVTAADSPDNSHDFKPLLRKAVEAHDRLARTLL
ncbi:hypothetical protein [Tahibacter sp.]|uniref:hypothetical protein n=1 Tax=Tahibacter sp. TaxID=2056211 RepID=UPI0028C3C35A|nr:hypothetical protein [Tahibacter sp.]